MVITEFDPGMNEFDTFDINGKGRMSEFAEGGRTFFSDDFSINSQPKLILDTDVKAEVVKWIHHLELIHADDSPIPMMEPQNNREYWLFTEYRQFLMDRFDLKEEDLK